MDILNYYNTQKGNFNHVTTYNEFRNKQQQTYKVGHTRSFKVEKRT
jgi:hypothetical protein